MSDALKQRLRATCGAAKHDTETCPPQCSVGHIEEFGDCIGVVTGPTDYNNEPKGSAEYDPRKVGPEVDVRWERGLRYAYAPEDLVLVWSVG